MTMIRFLIKTLLTILVFVVLLALFVRTPDKPLEELKIAYTNVDSEFANIDGVKVHYRVEGKGAPLVLIHGTGASLHTWDGWTHQLADTFTIIRMDLPAFGLTGPNLKRDYSIDAYVDFLNKFMSHLQIDDAHLAGNSLGGHIAWYFAVNFPDKVKKLILIDAAGYPDEQETEALVFQVAHNPLTRPILTYFTPKSFVRRNLEQVYANDQLITSELVQQYHDLALRPGNRQALVDMILTPKTDKSESISNIACPTLIMWGSEDTWTILDHGYSFERDIPAARLIVYDQVGHLPMEEAPRKSADDARMFLLSDQMDEARGLDTD